MRNYFKGSRRMRRLINNFPYYRLVQYIKYKVVEINEGDTSNTCFNCRTKDKKARKMRMRIIFYGCLRRKASGSSSFSYYPHLSSKRPSSCLDSLTSNSHSIWNISCLESIASITTSGFACYIGCGVRANDMNNPPLLILIAIIIGLSVLTINISINFAMARGVHRVKHTTLPPVIQEQVNTGNPDLDKQINKFYHCMSKTHEDPPSIQTLDNCYSQNSVGSYQGPGGYYQNSIGGISGGNSTKSSHGRNMSTWKPDGSGWRARIGVLTHDDATVEGLLKPIVKSRIQLFDFSYC
jgi:hypothetical protein